MVPPPSGAISGVGSTQLGSDDVYRPEWNLTLVSLLTQPSRAHEWCCHAFPPTTLESLKFLSHSHMGTDLQYVVAQVALYLVATASRLRYLDADLEELAAVKTKA